MAVSSDTLEGSGAGFARTLSAPTASAPSPSSGEFPVADWSRYTFVRRLGEGGMGAVYEARDLKLGRAVALKFIRGGDPRLAMRLAQEARAQARLDHPNVCKVYEVGEVQGKAYIAMELVDGLPLGELAKHLSLHDKVQLVREVALALHEAHKLGILHRDVKPANILVETLAEGRLRPIVMDFGLAREEGGERGLTETGALVGTPAYMSPEQARGGGRSLDRRADVYSLGATLYELLSGEPPFGGDSVMTVLLAVLYEEPERLKARMPQVPEDLDVIVSKCLNKEPSQRYDSAKALADDLERYIKGEPIVGKRESMVRKARRVARKHRGVVIAAALALVAASVAGGQALRARSLAKAQAAALEVEARTGRELGQDVKEMEWFLRAAHLLPLHDVTRERAIVRERMAHIAERAPASATAAALVDYAVGRGHLALREDNEAHERLSRASRAGLDTPELHYALGLVQGRLYQREMAEARRGGLSSWVERRTKEIELRYLQPALASMEQSRGVRLEAPSYLEGLMAFYRRDHEAALRLARKARAEAPWLYEALQLEAEIHLARGVERKDRGENEAAAQDLSDAGALFDAAAEFGRSDAALYEGAAEARIRRMEMAIYGLVQAGGALEAAVDRCTKAALARPDRSEPYTELAYAHYFASRLGSLRPGEVGALLSKELQAAEKALAIGGGDFATYERLSGAHFSLALDEMERGADPLATIDRAVTHAQRAIEASPGHPWGHTALGTAIGLRASIRAARGQDPTGDFAAGVEASWKATQLDTGYAIGYANLLESYVSMARWHAERGLDPRPPTREAALALAGCNRANPNYVECHENAGGMEAWRAVYLLSAGADARETLARARESLERAAAHGGNLENRQRLAHVHLIAASDARRRGDDPGAPLASMVEILADCRRLSPNDAACNLLDARRELLLADLEASRGRPTRAGLLRARALAEAALSTNVRDPDTNQILAESEARLAATEGSAVEQRKRRVAGLDACARGLAINPHHPRLLATRGALELQAARGGPAQERAAGARAARASFEEALRYNPLLGPTLSGAQEEAARLAVAP